MKLYYSTMSPFARKAIVLAQELGLPVEPTAVLTTPTKPDPALIAQNPLGKIPTLVTESGETLYDSRVICEYLDSMHSGKKWIPASGDARWSALRMEALADGITDAAVLLRYETHLRPETLRWSDWVAAQTLKVNWGLDSLESLAGTWGESLHIGHIAVACAIGYLEFRKPVEKIREGRPNLFDWYDKVIKRPSFRATDPRAS